MDSLTIEVAKKLGVEPIQLMDSIQSSINATNTILFILGIIGTIATLAIWAIKADDCGGFETVKGKIIHRVCLFGFIVILLVAIYKAIAYQHTYFIKLLEIAKVVGV